MKLSPVTPAAEGESLLLLVADPPDPVSDKAAGP